MYLSSSDYCFQRPFPLKALNVSHYHSAKHLGRLGLYGIASVFQQPQKMFQKQKRRKNPVLQTGRTNHQDLKATKATMGCYLRSIVLVRLIFGVFMFGNGRNLLLRGLPFIVITLLIVFPPPAPSQRQPLWHFLKIDILEFTIERWPAM
jgi:hypothetical protein